MNVFGKYSRNLVWLLVTMLALILSGCGGDDSSSSSSSSTSKDPATTMGGLSVSSTGPGSDAAGVSLNSRIVASFSEAIDPTTIDTTSFTVAAAGQSAVVGTVTVDTASNTATFSASGGLTADTQYTATITSAAKSLTGESLGGDHTWTFTTGEKADTTAPEVTASSPADTSTDVAINRSITATFSETMDPSTFTTTTFTLTGPDTDVVAGTVSYVGTTATFTPAEDLAVATLYTVTLTTGVKDLAANSLVANVVQTFKTGNTLAQGPTPVNLGTAGNYAILAKSAITTTGTTQIDGDIGLSPAAESFITGFSQTRHSSNEYSISDQVNDQIFAANMHAPTPSLMTTAIGDMELAYTDAAGRPTPDEINLGAGNISGKTLEPGLYKWSTGLLLASDITLSGGANDVWILQIAQDLTVESGVAVTLAGGALAKNIFWQVGGAVTLETTSKLKGIILSKTNIEMKTGASLNGRALAQTAVTLQANAVTEPAL